MTLRSILLGLVLLLSGAVHAALPEVLPYGTDELPVPPSPRKNETDPKVVDLLGGQLASPDPLERARILGEIGACQMPSGAPYVRKGLADEHPLVRAAAARAAGLVGDKSLVDDLKKAQKDPDARVRRNVVLSAAALGDASIVTAGLADVPADALASGKSGLDTSVVAAAVSVASRQDTVELTHLLPKYPPDIQLLALRSIGRVGVANYVPQIHAFITGEGAKSVALRAAAIEAIGKLKGGGHPPSGEYVQKALTDPHPTLRRTALTAMASILMVAEPQPAAISKEGVAKFQPLAIAALADADLSVREHAANWLAKTPTPDAIDALVANLPSESVRLHDAARAALIAIGQPAVPRTEQMLADAEPRRREDASYILGKLKSDAGIDQHIKLLADTDWGVIRQAAESLGRIGRKEAVPELVRLANLAAKPVDPEFPAAQVGPYYGALEWAIVGCAYFDERSIVPLCSKILPDKKHAASNVRSAAAYALGRMDDAKGPVPGMIGRILADPEDASDVKFEGLKALGHMKASAAKTWAGSNREDMKAMGDRNNDWVAWWVRWRMSGQEVPYEPLPETWSAPVSINVLP